MPLRFLLSIAMSLLALIGSQMALAGPCLSVCKGGKTYVYRGDSRTPSEVFKNGFAPRGNNLNMQRHLSGGASDDGFVSTTRNPSVAIYYAAQRARDTNQAEGFLYEIEIPNGVLGTNWRDIPAEYPNDRAVQANQEIAYGGTIPGAWVRRSTSVEAAVGTQDRTALRVSANWRTNSAWSRQNPQPPIPVMLGALTDPAAQGTRPLESCSRVSASGASGGGSRDRRDTASDAAPAIGYCKTHPDATIRQWPPCRGTTSRICRIILSS